MRRLILFAKRAVAGRVKTRLIPPLRPDQAASLYRGFVADGLAMLGRFQAAGCMVERCTDRLWRNPLRLGIPVTLQCPGDLGARMLDAFRRAAGAGSGATVIIGADAPTLPPEHVEAAFDKLAGGADAVITPAADGGYVLIGCTRPLPGLFTGLPWGTGRLVDATREAAGREGILLAETEPWYDVDREDDLHRLHRELQTPQGRVRAPATREALRAVWTQESWSC